MAKKHDALEKMTVADLRALARKAIGEGHSRLRTKAQLLAALAGPAAAKGRAKGTPAAVKGKAVAPKVAPKKKVAAAKVAAKAPARKVVAKVAPVRRAPAAKAEPLLALPVDAQTLFVRWGAGTQAPAGARLEVEVSADGGAARAFEVPENVHQIYLRALPPGRVYRAALFARQPDGARRPLGVPSRPMVLLKPLAPLPRPERFVRFSWSDPAGSVAGPEVSVPGHGQTGAALAGAAAQLAAAKARAAALAAGATSPRATSFAR